MKQIRKRQSGTSPRAWSKHSTALAHGANHNAVQNDLQQKDLNAVKNGLRKYKTCISTQQAIGDTIGMVSLTFIETDKKSNQSYSVVLKEGSIKYINREKFIIESIVSIYSQSSQKGQIEYNFNTGTFYLVNFYGNGRIRKINPIRVHYTSKDITDYFLTFISNFLYSEDD